jgi:hypothetical protein
MGLNRLLTMAALFMSLTVSAGEWEINSGYSSLQHSWTDKQGTTRYTPDMVSVGIGYKWDNGFQLSYLYGKMDETSDSAGAYPFANIDFKHINGLELSYRVEVGPYVEVFGGVGAYLIPTDHIWYSPSGNGQVVGGKKDSDDDEGYFFGVDIELTESLSLRYKYSHYSDIDEWDEYIRGHGGYLVYKF